MYTLLIFFVSIVTAWYVGFHSREENKSTPKKNIPRDYLRGLNFLLNEEPDKAVDIFIKMLEVDSDTVETHLAVGKLFRRRGEVDRAIRIHQNLIARPQLDKAFHDQSLFELGQDYYSAGVLDRAERIFLELSQVKEFAVPALTILLEIYHQEKAWENAIKTVSQLESAARKTHKHVIAHYYCEISESMFAKEQLEDACDNLKKALDVDKNCVRASLLLAKIEMKRGDYKAAIKNLKRVKDQNPDYLSEAIDPLATCYEAINEEQKLVTYLLKILDEFPRIPVVLILSERIRKWKGDKTAANFVADYVRRFPSLSGLSLFINLYLSNTEGRARDDLIILQNLMNKLLKDKPDFQCVSCGFPGKSLHWHCPGCKQWNSIKPVHVLETES
jgi:lipopolysaccharide biosynthesis regulator YciM